MGSQIYITLLIGFGGIILGFLLTQLGNYLQGYREDKRVLKQVLFNQLDIWFEMKRADVESFVPLLVEKFRAALLKRGAKPEEVNKLFANSLTPLVALLRSMKLADPKRLQGRYQESVNQLAKVDPLLAYQLSGRPDTASNEIIETFIAKAIEAEGKTPEEINADETASFYISFLKGYSQQSIFKRMESDILDVASKISYLTRFHTRRRIQELTIKISEEADKYVDQLLNSLIQHTAQHRLPLDAPESDANEFTD